MAEPGVVVTEQLDELVESFLGRPLDGGPYPYVWPRLTQKVREGGHRIVGPARS